MLRDDRSEPPPLQRAETRNRSKRQRTKMTIRRAALTAAWRKSHKPAQAAHRCGDDDEAAASDESPLQRSDRAHAAHAAHRCDGDDNDDAGRDAHPLPHSHDDGRADRVEVAW